MLKTVIQRILQKAKLFKHLPVRNGSTTCSNSERSVKAKTEFDLSQTPFLLPLIKLGHPGQMSEVRKNYKCKYFSTSYNLCLLLSSMQTAYGSSRMAKSNLIKQVPIRIKNALKKTSLRQTGDAGGRKQIEMERMSFAMQWNND